MLEANATSPGTYTGIYTATSATSAISINRQSGVTDFTFDNVSVKQVRGQYIGPELVVNGTFDGVAEGTDPVGNLSNYHAYGTPTTRQITEERLQLTTDGSNEGIRYNVSSLTAGAVYHIRMDISGDGSDIGAAVFIDGGGNSQVPTRSAGKIDTFFAPASTNIQLYLRAGDNTAGTTFYDNISVKEVGGAAVMTNMDPNTDLQLDTPY